MVVKKFEDLIAWQKAKNLCVEICSKIVKKENVSFYDQIFRASLSISNNISEGFGRNSQKEFKRFIMIALGSANEVKSMLILGREIGVIKIEFSQDLEQKADEVIRIIIGLSNKIKI
ncbi:four helix bundle protein [Sandaracinomonas limnophila]|uniref:Four helix bundle protein n=1 Tax=Sandaracinomonas limnophila TaxID=1862386 RepID=A0A437PTZ2_9BACT|nr:four helix bundle protein [Sandaracinomonas limnophila]RVU25724.1 four helix bundle protein [Sandaracinomonas limnophila]